ncbi:hypothetical protein SAMN04488564_103271 [Lentzea waywayandensis]|uniref:Uncharacterized protein n=1 Tax=Lentzea waywayandensis TaxID=84724 RepID=A0A1I6DXB1_9PSEU|nr:hypothetical protein [Lentzea waywayandensis]SFR09928.1 hypothetical protein SAMN04488564_103271 [Lentzea waywayandensis]
MNIIKAAAGLAAVAAALTFAPFANAQSSDGFQLDKTEYAPGDYITISYDVSARCEGKAYSNGFINWYSSDFLVGGPKTYVAEANASFVPGSYTAELTCKGEKVTRAFTVAAPRDKFTLDKTEVEAGGDISVMKTKQSDCGEVATSPGFTAPIKLEHESVNLRIGNGKVVDQAGTYQAEMTCGGKQVQVEFVVTAKAPAQAVADKPKAAAKSAKSPIVKPKGAPQTGGGATA